jgi:flavin-dependent dehydrogenase
MATLRITKVQHDERGFWTANVTVEGATVRVDNRLGSWTHTSDPKADPGSRKVHRREVLPWIAKRLADRVRRALRGEVVTDEAYEIDADVGGGTRNRPKDTKPDPKAIAERMARAARSAVEGERAA